MSGRAKRCQVLTVFLLGSLKVPPRVSRDGFTRLTPPLGSSSFTLLSGRHNRNNVNDTSNTQLSTFTLNSTIYPPTYHHPHLTN